MRPLRICVDCQARHRNDDPRCRDCYLAKQRRRNRTPERQALYGGAWRTTSRRARALVRLCARCGSERDLTLDHETGQVECRSCNSSHRKNPGNGRTP